MRFLRRGGKDGLAVEVETADPADATEVSARPARLEPDGAEDAGSAAAVDGAPGSSEPEVAEHEGTQPREAGGAADAETVPGASEPELAAAAEPEPPAEVERAAEPSVAEPMPRARDLDPASVVAAAAEPAPRSRRKRAALVEPAPAATVAPEPDGAEPAPHGAEPAPPPSDDEDLAALVGGGRPAVEPEPEPAPMPAHPFAPNLVIDDSVWPDPLAEGRPAALRLASLHLRLGQHALARAELESLAGRGRLDEPALLDLAEVRWRTGDLSGAGDAANALLARGTDAPLALVIAAEAVAAAGRPSEARRLSARALEVVDGPLELVFAGMPRAMIWPVAATPEPSPEAPRRRGRKTRREVDGAPSTAAEAFAGGRAALAKGDTGRAALLLGVAMRLEPGFAEDVLRAVAGRDDQPLLALVRGDALRLLGREAEALEAFDRARGRSSASATASPEPAGPGLFDDDPG